MSEKSYKIPVIVGLILYAVAIVVSVIVTVIFVMVNVGGNTPAVVPWTILGYIGHFVLYLVCGLTVIFYKGEKRRLIGIIIFILMGVYGVGASIVSFFMGRFLVASTSAIIYAATSTLNTTLTLFTTPFTSLTYLLMIIGIARFGVSSPEDGEIEAEE